MKLLLLGDSCTDVYQYGYVDRVSPEAPVPVFVPTRQLSKKGMAANVGENLNNLLVDYDCYLGGGSVKTRFIDERSHQQLMRVDEDSCQSKFKLDELNHLDSYDGIVISDYNKGFLDKETLCELVNRVPCPVFLDTKKKDLSGLESCFIKINEHEYNQLDCDTSNIIVTRGQSPIVYNGKEYPIKNTTVFDVTGAGDTFLASLAFKYIETQNMNEAIPFAIAAASVTVQHFGVYAPTLKEIHDEIRRPS